MAQIAVTVRIRALYGDFSGGSDTWNIPALTGRTFARGSTGLPNGIPPQVRGEQVPAGDVPHLVRYTPACTGRTRLRRTVAPANLVYPRMYGANATFARADPCLVGIPPQVRG